MIVIDDLGSTRRYRIHEAYDAYVRCSKGLLLNGGWGRVGGLVVFHLCFSFEVRIFICCKNDCHSAYMGSAPSVLSCSIFSVFAIFGNDEGRHVTIDM